MARASDKLPYQLYLYTDTHVLMEKKTMRNGPTTWYLPRDSQNYDDAETRTHMVQLLQKVAVPWDSVAIYEAKIFVISHNGQETRVVAVRADERLVRNSVYLQGNFIEKSVILDETLNIRQVDPQTREIVRTAQVNELPEAGQHLSGYRLVLTAGNETDQHILLDFKTHNYEEYYKLPGNTNEPLQQEDYATTGRKAMRKLLSLSPESTAIFSAHQVWVDEHVLLILVAHVKEMPRADGMRHPTQFSVPRGKVFYPLTNILKDRFIELTTRWALQVLRDNVRAIDFKDSPN